MPIYEFRCPNGHTFEVFQRMTDPPPPGCEVCGAGPVEKVLFPVAVHFKGKGFYSTDYGRGSRSGAKDGDSGSAGKDASAGSGSTGGDGGSSSTAEKKSSGGDGGSSSTAKTDT